MLGLKISLIIFISCLVLAVIFISVNFGISYRKYNIPRKRLKALIKELEIRNQK